MKERKEKINFLESLYKCIEDSKKTGNAIAEMKDLADEEVELIGNGHQRRRSQGKVSEKIKELLGNDYKDRVMNIKEEVVDLKNISTKDLVLELQKREGVSDLYIEPYQSGTIRIVGENSVKTDTVEGSCILLKIID